MSTQPRHPLTPEEYLEIERKAEFKSEYLGGEMFAMSGASRAHNLLAWNIASLLHAQLRRRACEAYSSDMRVHVPQTGLYTYPDVVVVCGEPDLSPRADDNLLNPTLLVEVLSPSTEAYDRGLKFEHYQSIESLKEYVLVSQHTVSVDLFTRIPEGWLLKIFRNPSDLIKLDSIGCELLLSDIYEKVPLSPEPPPFDERPR